MVKSLTYYSIWMCSVGLRIFAAVSLKNKIRKFLFEPMNTNSKIFLVTRFRGHIAAISTQGRIFRMPHYYY